MFARTPRLLLRPGWMEDAPALAVAIGDQAVARNLTLVPWPYSQAHAENFLSLPQDPLLPRLLVFTRTRGAPKLVGGVGISRRIDGRLELGYWIARPYWGLGFATEAARAVMGMARASGLTDIRAGHFVDNPASGNVLRKIGFRFSGKTERRFSPSRRGAAECLIFEEGSDGLVANDPAFELYSDAPPPLAA